MSVIKRNSIIIFILCSRSRIRYTSKWAHIHTHTHEFVAHFFYFISLVSLLLLHFFARTLLFVRNVMRLLGWFVCVSSSSIKSCKINYE
jgi:hypothetical protein